MHHAKMSTCKMMSPQEHVKKSCGGEQQVGSLGSHKKAGNQFKGANEPPMQEVVGPEEMPQVNMGQGVKDI